MNIPTVIPSDNSLGYSRPLRGLLRPPSRSGYCPRFEVSLGPSLTVPPQPGLPRLGDPGVRLLPR
jgi:hypothetical protein